MPEMPDSDQLLAQATRDVPRRDAEILLAAAWNLSRPQLLARSGEPVPAEVALRFEEACRRRAAGHSVAYLLGQREFWSMRFEVVRAGISPSKVPFCRSSVMPSCLPIAAAMSASIPRTVLPSVSKNSTGA